MAQNREPPAFQEYAAAMMAKTDYRLMSLAGRGLLYSLRLECWVNRRLPEDPQRLARVLGFGVAEVAALLPEVLPFFAIDGDGLHCPELDDYRSHVEGIREKQSQGGKQGAAKTNRKHQQPAPPTGPGNPTSNPQVTCESLVQSSLAKSNSIQVLTVEPVEDEWVNEYSRASNGY